MIQYVINIRAVQIHYRTIGDANVTVMIRTDNNSNDQSFDSLVKDQVSLFVVYQNHDYLPFVNLLNKMDVVMDHKIVQSKIEIVRVILFVVVNITIHMDAMKIVVVHLMSWLRDAMVEFKYVPVFTEFVLRFCNVVVHNSKMSNRIITTCDIAMKKHYLNHFLRLVLIFPLRKNIYLQ